MADPATYEMKFTFTWNEVCHPGTLKGYSVFPPVWSWPVGVSHNAEYRMWDACMDDVSVGVGLISQIGLTFVIEQEFEAARSNILDRAIYSGPLLYIAPETVFSMNLKVDKDHQLVSAVSNRGPTPDQLVGVADLDLCDGEKWRQSVKVCFELFSTGAASERVAGEMERNSVQFNNCSFGYIQLNLVEVSLTHKSDEVINSPYVTVRCCSNDSEYCWFCSDAPLTSLRPARGYDKLAYIKYTVPIVGNSM